MQATQKTLVRLTLATLIFPLLISCSATRTASAPPTEERPALKLTPVPTPKPAPPKPTPRPSTPARPKPLPTRHHHKLQRSPNENPRNEKSPDRTSPDTSPDQKSPDEIGADESQWFQQLKTGAILYDVPQQMTISVPSTVTVTITGPQAAPAQGVNPGAQTAPVKVSNFMRVTLSQDDNPDEFTVAHGQNPDEQFVPVNSSASWTWTVTPKHLGQNLKVRLQAFVIYSDPSHGIQQSFPAASKQITVITEGIRGIADNARDNFWSNPAIWIKYMLPGGAGFAALAAILAWWLKRKKPGTAKDNAAKQ